MNAQQLAQIDRWYASKVSSKEMAHKMGIGVKALMRYARRNGIARASAARYPR
jgi:hypothetical protein